MRQDTLRCIEKYKVNTLLSRKNIESAECSVRKDDVIHYISQTNMKVTARNTKRSKNYTGVIVITEERIYLHQKAGWESGTETFDIKDLVRVAYKANGNTGSTFTLTMTDAEIVFMATYDKRCAAELYEDLNSLIRSVGAPESTPTAIDAVSEIKRYKELLDIGAITQEEYDIKKRALLGL